MIAEIPYGSVVLLIELDLDTPGSIKRGVVLREFARVHAPEPDQKLLTVEPALIPVEDCATINRLRESEKFNAERYEDAVVEAHNNSAHKFGLQPFPLQKLSLHTGEHLYRLAVAGEKFGIWNIGRIPGRRTIHIQVIS